MHTPTVIKATRRSSTASNDAEKNSEDNAAAKHGHQTKDKRTTEIPYSSTERPKSPRRSTSRGDSSQQARRASPRRVELESARRTGSEFDREVRRIDSHRPPSVANQREAGESIEKPYIYETLGNRGRSAENQRLDKRQARYSFSQERARHGYVNNEAKNQLYYDEPRHGIENGFDDKRSRFEDRDDRRVCPDGKRLNTSWARRYPSMQLSEKGVVDDDFNYVQDREHYKRANNNQEMGTDSMRRPTSLGRYNGNLPSTGRHFQDDYENVRPAHGFPGNNRLFDRSLKNKEFRSCNLPKDQYAQVQRHQLPDKFVSDRQGRYYLAGSQGRRSKSVGRYEDDRRSQNEYGRSTFEEPQRRIYRREMPRFIEPYAHRYDEVDGNKLLQNPMVPHRSDQYYYDNNALDRYGFDRLGMNAHGYDRYGHRVFF